MEPCDEAEIMRRIAAGDVAAFELIVQRYWAELKLYVTHLAQDRDIAEDIAQEALARLWRARSRWAGKGSVRIWLLRTARNAFVTDLRKRRVRDAWVRGSRGRAQSLEPSPLAQVERAELRTAILEGIALLSPRRREAFTLVHLQGLSYREAAEIMEVRQQTVANYLQAAITDLRETLGNHPLMKGA